MSQAVKLLTQVIMKMMLLIHKPLKHQHYLMTPIKQRIKSQAMRKAVHWRIMSLIKKKKKKNSILLMTKDKTPMKAFKHHSGSWVKSIKNSVTSLINLGMMMLS